MLGQCITPSDAVKAVKLSSKVAVFFAYVLANAEVSAGNYCEDNPNKLSSMTHRLNLALSSIGFKLSGQKNGLYALREEDRNKLSQPGYVDLMRHTWPFIYDVPHDKDKLRYVVLPHLQDILAQSPGGLKSEFSDMYSLSGDVSELWPRAAAIIKHLTGKPGTLVVDGEEAPIEVTRIARILAVIPGLTTQTLNDQLNIFKGPSSSAPQTRNTTSAHIIKLRQFVAAKDVVIPSLLSNGTREGGVVERVIELGAEGREKLGNIIVPFRYGIHLVGGYEGPGG